MKTLINLKKGFTLIELLVVISILGILISVISVNLVTAQKQARDARRLEDLTNIQTAFESYFVEYGSYPVASPTNNIANAFDGGIIPTDPKSTSSYIWTYTSTAAYCVCASLETATGNASVPASTTCTWNSSGTYLCIQNKQ